MSFILPKPAALPPPPALPAPLASPPSYASGASKKAGSAGQIPSMGGTLLTSPIGPDSTFGSTNKTAQKSLLGQ